MKTYKLFDKLNTGHTAGWHARFSPSLVLQATQRFSPRVVALARKHA